MSIAVRTPHADAVLTDTLMHDLVTESGTWWAWECPHCGRQYETELHVCIEDGTPLRRVGFSLPFIWIG
jgi:hypothetical protein